MRSQYDIAIIGGGLAGASLACYLAATIGANIRISLLERFPMPESSAQPVHQPSFDARSTALSYGSRKIYEAMGLWDLLSEHVCAISDIHVSDRGHWSNVRLEAQQQDLPALGYVIENAWLGRCLMHYMQQFDNIDVIAPVEVQSLTIKADSARITYQQDDQVLQLDADLAVIADGVDSQLAQTLGIETEIQQYAEKALIANVSFSKPHQGLAYERFTEFGPLALLPLNSSVENESRAALVWALPEQQAKNLAEADEAEFLQALQQAYGYRQGTFTKVGLRQCHDLKLTRAKEQVRNRVLVLGNAAHTLHPVAGQGYNLVLRDIVSLSQLMAEHWQQYKTVPHKLRDLLVYQDRQDHDQWRTATFSDVLPKTFASNNAALQLGRGLGLLVMQLSPPLRTEFVRIAAGMA